MDIRRFLLLEASKTKAVASGFFARKPDRVDLNLPLQGRIGANVELDAFPYVIAQDAGTSLPGLPARSAIAAISSLWAGGLKAYRYHLDPSFGGGEAAGFLQIVCRGDDPAAILELAYFQEVHREEPQSDADWDCFLDARLFMDDGEDQGLLEDGHGIGGQTFTMPGGPDGEGIPFTRALHTGGAPDAPYCRPAEATEIVITDACGLGGMEQKLTWCQYARPLGDSQELLLIAVEETVSKDGGPDADVSIAFRVGIPLPLAAVRIL